MREPRFVLLVMLFLLIGGCASITTQTSDEAAVIQTLHDACRAYQDGDAAGIERLLTPDFTLTDADAVITTRADDIQNAKAGTITYTVFENSKMKARLYGDAAVVTGITTVKGQASGKPFAAVFQFTDTVVRQGNRWRVASSHISRLPAH